MSNVTVFNPAQLPAFARKGELSAAAKALAGGSAQVGKRISVRGGVFRLVDGGKEVAAIEDRHLDVVIVNAATKISRTYYTDTYDASTPLPPACWSADGDKPDASVKAPQSPNCVNCPQNAKGSGQGDSRACRFSQRLAVVLANDVQGDVLQLSLAATSIFGKAEGENRPLQDYARWLTAQGIDPTMLITRLKFDTKAATPKLFFKPMRWLTDDEYAITSEKGASEEAIKAVTMTVSQTDGVGVAEPAAFGGTRPKAAQKPAEPAEDEEPPAPAPKVAKPKAAQKPAPAEEEEPPVAAPTVRKAAAPAPNAVPAGGDLAATLAGWDD